MPSSGLFTLYYKFLKLIIVKSLEKTTVHEKSTTATITIHKRLKKLDKNYVATKGAVNTIKATAKEGTYVAVVTKNIYNKRVTEGKIAAAADKAKARAWRGKTFSTKKAMWQAIHTEIAKEMANLGINISFKPAINATKSKLVTQKIGEV